MDNATHLPDGSAFAIASYPLPKNHWLYAERVYMPGHDEPVELPTPVLTHVDRDRVVAAIRYAVRGATMCGKETDFDPDALVQNAVYALCGPYSKGETAMTDKLRDAAQGAIDGWNTRWKWGEFMQSMEALRAALDQPALAQQPAVPSDNGPWQVDEWTNNQIVLQSHDFTHDVALVINGDFESKDQKHQYAVALAAMLNAAPEPPAVQRESKAETALNKVLNVIQRYLPPDGPTINDAMSEIIGIVDPWPLDTQPEAPAAQKEQP